MNESAKHIDDRKLRGKLKRTLSQTEVLLDRWGRRRRKGRSWRTPAPARCSCSPRPRFLTAAAGCLNRMDTSPVMPSLPPSASISSNIAQVRLMPSLNVGDKPGLCWEVTRFTWAFTLTHAYTFTNAPRPTELHRPELMNQGSRSLLFVCSCLDLHRHVAFPLIHQLHVCLQAHMQLQRAHHSMTGSEAIRPTRVTRSSIILTAWAPCLSHPLGCSAPVSQPVHASVSCTSDRQLPCSAGCSGCNCPTRVLKSTSVSRVSLQYHSSIVTDDTDHGDAVIGEQQV